MDASLTNLPAVAQQILTLFQAQLTAQGVTLPERQYRQAGSMPAWDGEQLTTGLMGIAQGQPGMAYPQTFVPEALHFYATFFVLLIRKVHVVSVEGFGGLEIPTAAQQDEDGVNTVTDAQALVIAFRNIAEARTLVSGGMGLALDGLQPLGPQGALAGSRLLLSLSLS
jgi:hypothetical protein